MGGAELRFDLQLVHALSLKPPPPAGIRALTIIQPRSTVLRFGSITACVTTTQLKSNAIDPTDLLPQTVLHDDLYTAQGVKLLTRGTVLSKEICRTLASASWARLYLGPPGRSSQPDAREPPQRSELSPAHAPLAEPGQIIEPRLAIPDQFDVQFLSRDDRRRRARIIHTAERVVASHMPGWNHLPRAIPTSILPTRALSPVPRMPAEDELASARRAHLDHWVQVRDRIVRGYRVDVSQLLAVVDPLIDLAVAHPGRFTALALPVSPPRDHLPDHALASCCIATAIAHKLEWARDHIRMASLAALLADLGMTFICEDLRASPQPLSDEEHNRSDPSSQNASQRHGTDGTLHGVRPALVDAAC